MKRVDQEVEVDDFWDCKYDDGEEANTVMLSGSCREVDIIVRGLKALRAQITLNELSGVCSVDHARPRDINTDSLGDDPLGYQVDQLLKSIQEPNYVAEPTSQVAST